MVSANLIIIRILMIRPSVMLGFFFVDILKKTGVLSPDDIPTRVGMSFYIFLPTTLFWPADQYTNIR
jgi:hypothetical protein